MRTILLMWVALGLFGIRGFAAEDELSETLRKGLFEEEANQNLPAAIAAYQSAVDRFESQRKFAATAVFRLAECYRKLGKTNEAVAAFRRVLTQFSDQTALAEPARQMIAGLGGKPSEVSSKTGLEADGLSAEENQEMERVKAVMKNSPDLINAPLVRGGLPPLHSAASLGFTKVATYLLDHGTSPNDAHSGGNTALHIAVQSGNKTMVELLLTRGADPNALRFGNDPRYPIGGSPLHLAVHAGFQGIAELLLKSGATLETKDPDGLSPLAKAIKWNRFPMVKWLVEKKADLNTKDKRDRTLLMVAIDHHVSPSLIGWLLDKQVGINSEERGSLLALAVEERYEEAVKLLLDREFPVDWRDRDGLTPLLKLAISYGQNRYRPSLASLLLEGGADPNAADSTGSTPLHWSLEQGNAHLVELLLNRGARLDLTNAAGESPFAVFSRMWNDGRNSRGRPVPLNSDGFMKIKDLILFGGPQDFHRPPLLVFSRTRSDMEFRMPWTGTLLWGKHTLLDIFGDVPHEVWRKEFPFPRLNSILQKRLNSDGTAETNRVDLEAVLKSGSCLQTIEIREGDLFEFPEDDHVVGAGWEGFPDFVYERLEACLERGITLVVKGRPENETLPVQLYSSFSRRPGSTFRSKAYFSFFDRSSFIIDGFGSPFATFGTDQARTLASFRLNDVVRGLSIVRTSSDQEHVKVRRKDATTGKVEEREFDLTKPAAPFPILREGDVVEIPEKQP